MYIMKEKAADYGVEVTSDDETAIADAAAQFMQDNDEDTLKELAVSEDQVKTLLELETYRQRIYDPIRCSLLNCKAVHICNCQSRKHLIIYSNISIIQPFLSCLGIVFAALGVLKGLFLGSGCILVIYFVHPKHIYAAISLNQLAVNFAVLQSSQRFYRQR